MTVLYYVLKKLISALWSSFFLHFQAKWVISILQYCLIDQYVYFRWWYFGLVNCNIMLDCEPLAFEVRMFALLRSGYYVHVLEEF